MHDRHTNTGITGQNCVTLAHETLPWESHYHNLVAAPEHAWVAFAPEHDPQVREAATRAQAAARVRDHDDSDGTDGNIPVLDAYSDGSVLAKGVEGSAAALVRVFGTDVSVTVRLASLDVALSSGRSEWVGLVMVLCILREVCASVVVRLGNLQVVNTFNDGEWRFRRNWLRRNDRDMAMLAWALDRERRQRGFGELTALHQLGHAEKRKKRSEFDVHERYNDIVDGLTHEINESSLLPQVTACLREGGSLRHHTDRNGTMRTTIGDATDEKDEVTCDLSRGSQRTGLHRWRSALPQPATPAFSSSFLHGI